MNAWLWLPPPPPPLWKVCLSFSVFSVFAHARAIMHIFFHLPSSFRATALTSSIFFPNQLPCAGFRPVLYCLSGANSSTHNTQGTQPRYHERNYRIATCTSLALYEGRGMDGVERGVSGAQAGGYGRNNRSISNSCTDMCTVVSIVCPNSGVS